MDGTSRLRIGCAPRREVSTDGSKTQIKIKIKSKILNTGDTEEPHRAPRNHGLTLTVEVGDALHHGALLRFGEFGEQGQGEDFLGGALGLGEVAGAISEVGEAGLQMQR